MIDSQAIVERDGPRDSESDADQALRVRCSGYGDCARWHRRHLYDPPRHHDCERLNARLLKMSCSHHVSATFEPRADVVKAPRPAQRIEAQRRALTMSGTVRYSKCDSKSDDIWPQMVSESAWPSARHLRRVARANGANICAEIRIVCACDSGGVSDPPNRLRGDTGRKAGGSLTPPFPGARDCGRHRAPPATWRCVL